MYVKFGYFKESFLCIILFFRCFIFGCDGLGYFNGSFLFYRSFFGCFRVIFVMKKVKFSLVELINIYYKF